MAATIRVARGNKAAKGGLLYGELFWQKVDTGEEGTLYIGKPDGASGEDLAIGGARAMQSLYYKGQHSGAAFPADAKEGDFWVMSANGSGVLVDYKKDDWVVCIGASQFTRVNNSGGIATEIAFDNTGTNFDATSVDSALRELEAEKLQYITTLNATNEVPGTPVIGGFYLIGSNGVVIDTVTYSKGDFAYHNGTDWVRIESGFATAAEIDYDPTGISKPIAGGTPVITTTVQGAIDELYTKKADLDATGKIPLSQFPATTLGSLQYQGAFDAANETVLPADPSAGDYYVASSVGTVESIELAVGDWIVYNGSAWDKIDNTEKLSGLVVDGQNLTGTPTIQGSNKIDVSAAGGIITVAGQNLVDKSGTTTAEKIPVFTADGTIGDSHITDSGTEVNVDADLTVGESTTLVPKKATINGDLIIEPTGTAGVKTDHTLNLGSEQGGGVVKYAKVKAPEALPEDATIILPDADSTLIAQKNPTTANTVPKIDSDGYIADSNITDDGSKVTVAVPIEADGGLVATDVDITDGSGNKVNIEAPGDLVGDIAVTLPSTSGQLATVDQVNAAAGGGTAALESAVDGTQHKIPVFEGAHEIGDSIITQKADTTGIEVDGTVQAKAQSIITSSDGLNSVTLDASALGVTVTQTIPSHSGTLLNDNSAIDGGEY